MPEIVMPRLSDSMEEGTILKWLKSDGDEVKRGEELVEIETDKANMTYEADSDGTLTIVAKEGDTLPVGETIARLGDGSESGGEDEGDDVGGDLGVVHGVGEVVTRPGRAEVDLHLHVDDERLPVALLVVEDPVDSIVVRGASGTSEFVRTPTLCAEVMAGSAAAFDRALAALDAAFPGERVAGKILSDGK